MRLIVSDTSCLIDLRKASLLEALIRFPYEISIPEVLFEELLRFELAKIDLRETNSRPISSTKSAIA
jgi:predicted nucleic acid-binding protein